MQSLLIGRRLYRRRSCRGKSDGASVFWRRLGVFGGRIHYLPMDANGAVEVSRIDFDSLAAVSVMAANNETGVFKPLEEIARRTLPKSRFIVMLRNGLGSYLWRIVCL